LGRNTASKKTRNLFPFEDKRLEIVIGKPKSDDLAYGIGNLDDFEDEERASWAMTKKLRKWLPLVPPQFGTDV